ncbi:MAG: hypothetical protein MZW92_53900 [Comamonadaceae bacterium]|nr:hypothetical protein [Comamonadaceae bacterium]
MPVRGQHDRDQLRPVRGEVRAQAPEHLDAGAAGAHADDGAARAQLHPARAQGRGADHRAVELPAVDGRRAAGRRHRRGQLRGDEALRGHRAHLRGDRCDPAALPRQGRVRGRRGRHARDHRAARAALRPHPLHRQRARGARW